MIRSIRRLNSPDPPRLFNPGGLPAAGRLAVAPLNPANPRHPRFTHRLVASLAPSRCREPRLPPPTMEPLPEDHVYVSSPDRPDSVSAGDAEPNPSPSADPEPLARSFTEDPAPVTAAAAETSGGPEVPGASVEGEGRSKRVFSEELLRDVVFLECESSAEGGTCEVYLVGTAHVSQESCRKVQEVIRCLKPQVVFLELCLSRAAILTPQKLTVPTVNEMIDIWKKKKMNAFGILCSWIIAKVADKLEVFPGSEFRVAFEEGKSYGAKVILGDRPIHITLRRTWEKMSLWHRAKFLFYALFQTIFLPSPEDLNKVLKEMDDVDMLTRVIQEMSKAFPTLVETLVHERDLYMSYALLKVASKHSSVVAVVGKGHLSGIKKHWKQPIEVKHLLEIPANGVGISRMKILASVGVAVTGVAIASALYIMGKG